MCKPDRGPGLPPPARKGSNLQIKAFLFGDEQFVALNDLGDGFAVDWFADVDAQEIAGGGEGVFGVDGELIVDGEVEIFSDAGADGDPGDVAAAGVVGAVGATGAAVVGGDEDECGIAEVLVVEGGEDSADAGVGAGDGHELDGGGPADGVADVVDAGEVDEHDLGLMFVDDLDGLVGDGGVFDFFLGGDEVPIDGAGDGEGVELSFAGGHGGGVAVLFGELEEGGIGRVDGSIQRHFHVPLDAVFYGSNAGEHAGVGGESDGFGGGAGPEGEAGDW